MPTIKFTKQGSSSVCGNFGPGDLLRCSDAVAAHLVNEAQVADYAQTPAPAEVQVPPADAAKPTRAKRARAGTVEATQQDNTQE